MIFTDLDGTLLDHHNYSFKAAQPTLDKLQDKGIPVIPNTSKTFAEVIELRRSLKLETPFIVENGAAVYIPTTFFTHQPYGTTIKDGFWVKTFSAPIAHWLILLENLQDDFAGEFQHFAAMSIEQIMQATGLTQKQAELAATREFCEPVLWLTDDASKKLFIQAAEELGASPLQGGRFLHITGKCDKGQALTWLLKEQHKQNGNLHCKAIALGDGHNDIAMLEAADLAVRILSPTSPPPALTRQDSVITSTYLGPSGWAECIEKIVFNSSL